MQNLSYENEFYLHMNGNSFSYEGLCTKTRFEKEVQGNSNGLFYASRNYSLNSHTTNPCSWCELGLPVLWGAKPRNLKSQCHPRCFARQGTFFIDEKYAIALMVVKSDLYLLPSLPLAI